MSFSPLFGVLLSVAWMSTLVVGSPDHVFEVYEFLVKNCENEYFSNVVASAKDTDRGSNLSLKVSVTKEVPESATAVFEVNISGQEPINKEMEWGDAMDDRTIVQGFLATAVGGFEEGLKTLPVRTWEFENYKPNMDPIPSGTEGDMDGSAIIENAGKILCEILFKGKLHVRPEISG